MILVDTSVWIDHLKTAESQLPRLLQRALVLTHSFVIGEIAVGSLKNRGPVLDMLSNLPRVTSATDAEALDLIERHRLYGQGLGYVDVHLLAATRLTPGAVLWTRDTRLNAAAERLDIADRGGLWPQ
jgi:hypothetical protein